MGNIALQFGPGDTKTVGALNLGIGALGTGPQSTNTAGVGNFALQLGPGTTSTVGGLNAAIGVTPGGTGQDSTSAGFFGTLALNLFGHDGAQGGSSASTQAIFGTAVNILGSSKVSTDGGIASAAINVIGNDNTVTVKATPTAF